MSYSFSARGADKAAAIAAVENKMAEVVAGQSVHAVDAPAVIAAARAIADLLQENPNRDVYFSVNGSVSCLDWGTEEAQKNSVCAVSVSVSVGQLNR